MANTYNDGLEYQGVKVPDQPPFSLNGPSGFLVFDMQTWDWVWDKVPPKDHDDLGRNGHNHYVKNRASFQAPTAATAAQQPTASTPTVPGSTQAYQLPRVGDIIGSHGGLHFKVDDVYDDPSVVSVCIETGRLPIHAGFGPQPFYFREKLYPDGRFYHFIDGKPEPTVGTRPFFDCLYNHPWFQATLNKTPVKQYSSMQVNFNGQPLTIVGHGGGGGGYNNLFVPINTTITIPLKTPTGGIWFDDSVVYDKFDAPKEGPKPCCITSYNNGGHASLDPDKLCYECRNEGR